MRRAWLFPLAAVAAALAAYLNALPASFQWDDFNVIVDHPGVHSLASWFADLKGGVRPLLKLSYALNWLAGPGPWGFHLVNNLIHAANAVLVFFLTERLAERSGVGKVAPWAALAAALLLALHPARTEAVTYVSGRSVSLMALFYLGSLLAFVEGRERSSAALNAGSALLFLAAAAVRETAVTLPFALLLWETGVEKKPLREALRAGRLHLLLLAAVVAAVFAHGRLIVRYLECLNDFEGRSLALRQTHGIFYLVTRWLSLTGRNFDPDLPEDVALTVTAAGEALVLLVLLAFGVWGFRKRNPAGFGVLWFFLHLLPTNSILPRYDVANERHLYLAALGLEWSLLLALARPAERRPRTAGVIGAALLLAAGVATVARNEDYRTEVALWEHTVARSPRKARAHVNLGYAYLLAKRRGEAEEQFLKALEIDPENETARTNLRAVGRP